MYSVNSISKAEGADTTSGFCLRMFTDDEECFKVSTGWSLHSEDKGM